jgi:hypothetical protein
MVSVIGLGKNCCSLEVCSSNVGGSGWKAMVVFCHKAETTSTTADFDHSDFISSLILATMTQQIQIPNFQIK